MYIQELLESTHKHEFGAKFYPNDSSESYILVRRAGTMSHKAKDVELSRKYPPLELLDKKAQEEQAAERLCEIVRDYFVVDMFGFKDSDTDEYVNYQKQKHRIFSGEESIGLINSIINFASISENYSKQKSKAAKDALEKYISVNIIQEADNEDWIQFFHSVGIEQYEKERGNLDVKLMALLVVYFDLKRDARGEVLTRPQCCEGALLIDYDFYECVDILLHVDDFYTRKNNEKLAKKANK